MSKKDERDLECSNPSEHNCHEIKKSKEIKYMCLENGRRVVYFGKKDRQYHSRYIMEQHLGRKLEKREQVHHIDENKLNDDIDNLQVMDIREHARHHSTGKIYPSRRTRVVKGCLVCKDEMMVKPSRLERKKFCSVKCKNVHHSKFRNEKGGFAKWQE